MKDFSQTLQNLISDLLAAIKEIVSRSEKAMEFTETEEQTYVIWYDNNGYPYEGQVKSVGLEDDQLYITVSAENGNITLWENYDWALTNPGWLNQIYRQLCEK